jgi:diaminohydroxyphosphoribosylaminopyrimidine deaminase/5-amino-6-(5-phosphoribosylamino)uracil reductase
MLTNTDIDYMRRALQIAEATLGTTAPNPAVGALIVKDGTILAQAATAAGGRPHAEIIAMRQIGEEACAGATLYVTLEPCAHYGKTPPCSDAIIAAKFARVVIACSDPDPRISGRGIATLQSAGIAITFGIEETAAIQLHAGFFKRLAYGEPLVTVKIATSLDGRIALANGESKWISNEASRQMVQSIRSSQEAILIGSETALADDPSLTCRGEQGHDRTPVRIVLDRRFRFDPRLGLAQTARTIPSWVITTLDATLAQPEKLATLQALGVRIFTLDGPNAHSITAALQLIATNGINRLLVEGGGTLLASLIQANKIDRFYLFLAPLFLGADSKPGIGPIALPCLRDATRFRLESYQAIEEDMLCVYVQTTSKEPI